MRNFSNWLKSFVDWTSSTESPAIFRKWAAIGAVSGVLQRRVWINTHTGRIYPNEFILLVAPPGIGKSVAIEKAEELVRKTSDRINILPTTVTKEKLYVEFERKSIKEVIGADFNIMCAGVAFPDELGIFIRAKDFDFMQDLIKFYDCKSTFVYSIKSGDGGNRLDNVALTILAGTQPDSLRRILPPEAFGMGFAARLIIIYSDQIIKQSIFGRTAPDTGMALMLQQDLQKILTLSGEFVFTREAEHMLEVWHEGGQEPKPTDRRLASYSTRRLLHLFKLSIIFSAAMSNDRIITAEHTRLALDTMFEAEQEMSKAFSVMGEGSAFNQIENVYSYILAEYARTNKPVPEHQVRDNLLREMPIYAVKSTLQEMTMAGWISIGPGDEGTRLISPKRKAQ